MIPKVKGMYYKDGKAVLPEHNPVPVATHLTNAPAAPVEYIPPGPAINTEPRPGRPDRDVLTRAYIEGENGTPGLIRCNLLTLKSLLLHHEKYQQYSLESVLREWIKDYEAGYDADE